VNIISRRVFISYQPSRDSQCAILYISLSSPAGARFAIYQVKIGLIKVLMNYKIDVCEKTEIPIIHHPMSHIMLQPKNGVHVRLIKMA